MKTNLIRVLFILVALGLCVYSIHCALHMREYFGTNSYWSNPWFFKAHASLLGIIILDGVAVALFGGKK